MSGRRLRHGSQAAPVCIQNIEHRAIGARSITALRNRFRQNGLELNEVGKFAANVFQMGACDLVYIGTGGALRSTQGEQGPDLL